MGQPVVIPMGQATATTTETPLKTSGMAVASMVCGIIGLFLFGIILGPLAIIFGCVAKGRISEKPLELQGNCQATAGIVCGILATVVWVVIVIVYY